MFFSQKRGEMHWSKDYMEHLRAIHFSLIVVCVGLIVIKTTSTATNVSKARAQISTILQLNQELNDNWLKKLVDARIAKQTQKPLIITFQKGNEEAAALVSAAAQTATIECKPVPDKSPRFAGCDQRDFFSLEAERHQHSSGTLADFRRLWDRLASIDLRIATLQGGIQDEIFVDYQRKYVPAVVQPYTGQQYRYTLELYPAIPDELDTVTPHSSPGKTFATCDRSYVLTNSMRSFLLCVGPVNEEPLNIQQEILDKHRDLFPGKFETSFAELDALTRGLQNDRMEELYDWLTDQERQHTSESFEAFGVKFPGQAIVRWGVFIIIGIQLYFLAHLRELSPKLSPGDSGLEVPWIGLYDSWLSRGALAATMLALPVVTVAALPSNVDLGLSPIWFSALAYSIAVLASCLIALATYRELKRLPQIARQSNQESRPASA